MDEYLFIVLAKLKADRLKLAREERIAAASQPDLFEEPEAPTAHRSAHRSTRARWFLSEPEWPLRT